MSSEFRLTYEDLGKLFQKLKCHTMMELVDNGVYNNEAMPLVLYRLTDPLKLTTPDLKELVHVVYASKVLEVEDAVKVVRELKSVVLIVKSKTRDAPELMEQNEDVVKQNNNISAYLEQRVANGEETPASWLSLSEKQRVAAEKENSTALLMERLDRLIIGELDVFNNNKDAYNALTSRIQARLLEEEEEPVREIPTLKRAAPLMYMEMPKPPPLKKGEVKHTVEIKPARELDEHKLAEMTDYVSLFVRAACGSIALRMIDVFILMPAETDPSRNARALHDYINTLNSTMRAAIMKAGVWMLDFSNNAVTLEHVALKYGNSKDPMEFRVYVVLTQLTGILYQSAVSTNPHRNLNTRFSIALNQRLINDTLDELRALADVLFNHKRSRRMALQSLPGSGTHFSWA